MIDDAIFALPKDEDYLYALRLKHFFLFLLILNALKIENSQRDLQRYIYTKQDDNIFLFFAYSDTDD